MSWIDYLGADRRVPINIVGTSSTWTSCYNGVLEGNFETITGQDTLKDTGNDQTSRDDIQLTDSLTRTGALHQRLTH